MKKLLSMIIVLILLPIFALADLPDLSGLSYEELVQLKDQINLAMWNSQEWQEVTVPQGLWVVGSDIPAGTWTVRCAADSVSIVTFGDTLNDTGLNIKYSSYYHMQSVVSPDSGIFDPDKSVSEFTFTVKDGDYIHISGASVIFTPPQGKPNFGFK